MREVFLPDLDVPRACVLVDFLKVWDEQYFQGICRK